MGKPKIKSNLSEIAKALPEYANKGLLKTGRDVAAVASQLSPYLTGELSGSYKEADAVEVVKPGLVRVGSDVAHAPYQEFGTEYMEPQAHLGPAFDESESIYTEHIRRELQRGIDEHKI